MHLLKDSNDEKFENNNQVQMKERERHLAGFS
jgi:hypothetical protein